MILGYWDLRGLGHSIRLLLEYTETPYKEKLYTCGGVEVNIRQIYAVQFQLSKAELLTMQTPDYDKSQWLNEKDKLGLDFPNLPYLIDGKTKLTQSSAILRYITRKHKLCGETEEELIRVDMLENVVMDFRINLRMLSYSTDFEKLKPGYLEQLPGTLKLFSEFLGDRKWCAGDKITFVDFVLYDVLDLHRKLEPKCLNQFKNLQDYLSRFEALEKIAAYLKSSRFLKCPIYNKMAKWGTVA